MSYVRKTTTHYELQVDYGNGHGFETVTAEDSPKAIRQRKREYEENEPGHPMRIIAARAKKESP